MTDENLSEKIDRLAQPIVLEKRKQEYPWPMILKDIGLVAAVFTLGFISIFGNPAIHSSNDAQECRALLAARDRSALDDLLKTSFEIVLNISSDGLTIQQKRDSIPLKVAALDATAQDNLHVNDLC